MKDKQTELATRLEKIGGKIRRLETFKSWPLIGGWATRRTERLRAAWDKLSKELTATAMEEGMRERERRM